MVAFILHLKPDLTLIIVACLGLFIGIILWLAGFRIARLALTMVLSAVGAFWGYLAPAMWHLPMVNIASALIMAVIGAILGSIGFRLMQALLVAALLAIAILSVGMITQHRPPPATTAPAQAHVASPATATQPSHGPHAMLWRVWRNAKAISQMWWRRVTQRPKPARGKAEALAFGVALVGLLLGLIFPRITSVVATASMGVAVLMLSLLVLGRAFEPKLLAKDLPQVNLWWLLAGGAAGGILLQAAQALHQRHQHSKEKAKKSEAKKAS